MTKTILVTGASGYIGSHCIVQLLKDNYQVVGVDNLANSKQEAIKVLQEVAGKTITFYELDLVSSAELSEVFSKVCSIEL